MFARFCNETNVCLCIKPPKGTLVTQCMCMRIYVYASVCMYVCMNVACMCVRVLVSLSMYLCRYVCMYSHVDGFMV